MEVAFKYPRKGLLKAGDIEVVPKKASPKTEAKVEAKAEQLKAKK